MDFPPTQVFEYQCLVILKNGDNLLNTQIILLENGKTAKTLYQLCTKFIIFAKKTDAMTKKKDLYNLHCRVKHSTAEKLKAWSEELGLSLGEEIDQVVEGFEEYCKKEDEVLEKTDLHDILERLLVKVERIEKRVGSE